MTLLLLLFVVFVVYIHSIHGEIHGGSSGGIIGVTTMS